MFQPGNDHFFLQFIGSGLHTGSASRVTIEPGQNFGHTLFNDSGEISIGSIQELQYSSNRCTKICHGNFEISTVEHLFAALLFFTSTPLTIKIEGPELPILDGSALPFFTELTKSLSPEFPKQYDCRLNWKKNWIHNGKQCSISVEPAESFFIEYHVDILGERQSASASVDKIMQLFSARTYIEYSDLLHAQQQGMLQHVTNDMGILIEKKETGLSPANGSEWRLENECAAHKILDFAGDISLFRQELPKLWIKIENGGHDIHLELLKRIINLWHS